MDELTLTFNSPLTEEDWDVLEDVDFDRTNSVWFHTKHGKDVEFIKVVRCKDCQWCQYDEVYGQRWCGGGRVEPDGYCSYGKRKDMPLGADNSEPHVELEPITGERKVYHGELDVRNGKLTIYGSDRCVCCGEPVPEGRMVCPVCERRANE